MGECTSKEWGRGKKKMVKKKLTRAEVESLIPRRPGMTASEAAGSTDVIMAAMEDVSTSWEFHDDGDDGHKDDHHEDQSRARKAEQVKRQDAVDISTRTEVPRHNLEKVVENDPPSSVANAQMDKEKHDHPMICTTASSSQHSESLIESFEYVQHRDTRLSDKETEIKSDTLLAEYLAAQQTFEKLSANAPRGPEHRNKEIIEMIHSTGLLESVNKRIQDLLQLQLQSDTQVVKEQDMSESEREQMKDSLTIGGSTQQMSESYIVNLQKALQLIQLKEATETEHEIGPEDPFAPEKVNTSECCGTSKICSTKETAGKDTNSNLKQKILAEAKLASLENSTVASKSELKDKLVNASILQQEQIKEVESMSNPGESDSNADNKAENSLSIEEKDISPKTQVIQPTGISSISGINETDMEDKTANPILSLEFQIVEHALISQEGKDKKINQIEYINKDDGGLKQALEFEIAASQNVDTPENANKLSSDEKQSFHVPTVNKTMPTQEEDDLTSEEIDKIDQASVTENFESPDIKLNCETDIDSVEVLQPMKVATDDDLQEVKESTTQPMQHAESTVNENSPVLCDMTIITNGATTDECTDGEETNGSSPKFELPIHTDKEDGYVEKAIGRTEECQVQQVKLYEDNILEGSKLEPAASSEKIFKTSDHCFRQELVDAIKVVQTQPEEEENIKSHIKANNDQSEHPTSDEIQTNSTREMFPPTIQACVLTNESQRSEIATYMVQDNEPLGTEYLANHHDITAKTHNAEAAERTRRHRESEISPFLEQQMTHEKVLEQKSQLHPPDLAQPLEMMVQPLEISEIVSSEGSQHQEESTVVVNVAAGSEKETEKAPESPRDLSLSFDKEETPSLHYTNKFNLLVPITEVEASKAVSTLDTDAMADEDNSLVLEKRSNNLLGTNTAHSTVQQEEATLNVQITYIKESVVVSNVAAGSEKQTAKTPESPRDLMFSYDKEEDTSMHETTKSNLLVPITEVEVSCTVSAFNAGAITDKSSSPSIDARNDDLLKIFNNSLALVQHTEANLHEKMSSSEDPTAMNYVAAGIEKETVSETPESTKDLLPSLEKEGSSSSHESDNSNHVTPIPQVQELEAVSAFDTVAVTNEESICLSVTEMENNDLKGMTDNAPALVRQGESILNKQMSSTEDSVIVTNVVTGFDKEPARKIQEPTRYINSSFEKEEASSSYTTDGSDLTIQILEVKSSQDALAFEMGSMTKNNDPPVIESGNDDMVRMNNTGTSLSQKTDAILHAQISSGENSVAASHVAVVPVPEVKESEAVSAFNQGATTRDSYPAIDTADHDLLEIPIIVPVLSRQTEATQYGQMLCTKDSLVATHVTGIVKEAANMTTESSRDLKLSFDEEETSSSFQTDEYNITMPIPEVEASKAIAAFDTGKMTHKDSSQVIERGYNDLLGANETVSILVQPVEPTLHEKTFSIEDAVIMNHFSAGMGEATESDTSEKARNLQLSINEEEVASSHETDKSNLMVQIQDTEATEAISDLYASAMTDKNNSPVIESGNYKLQGMTDTTTVLDQQVELASVQKMSFEEEAIVVTHVSARIEKETSSDTPESTRSLQQPFEEEDASSSHETDEFELVSLPEDTTPGAVPTFDIGEGADKDSSPVMETGNNKLNVMASTVDNLVARTEAIQNEQMSSTDDSEVVTHVALGIEKETASKTLESMEDSQISFEDKETSNSYDIDASYLPVPIPQSAEFKVPAFDTGAMADERISPIIETRNDDSQKLTADLLVPINNTPCLDHQVEATLHQKMSSIEVPVDERNVSPGMEMETVSETTESTRDLQLSFNQEESLCERDRSNPDITITEVEASEATSEFDPVAMTDKTKFPVIESENNDSLGMTHTKTGLVQQDGDALLEQMSHVEDSKVVTQVSAEIANETSSETLQSTRDLQLPLEEKETSSLHGNEKSSLMVEIPRVEEEDASRSHETDKSDLTVPTLQVEEEDGSNSSETDKANLIIPIPEDISTFDRGADAHEDGSLVRETGYNKLGGDTNPVPALVPQAEATLNGQLSSTDNSVVGSQDVTGVQAETANETPESTGDLQHSFKKEEDSNTYDIDKSNLAVPILEVEATESVSALVTDAITDNENSPDKHTGNDDSLGLTDNIPVLTNIKAALVQQTGNITNEEILSIKDSVVEKNNAVRTEKETMSELTESTGDLKFKLKEEESSHEIDKSKITIPIPEVEESDAAPAFEAVPVTDKIMIPDIQSENNDFLGMTNTKTALVQQDGGSLLEQMSYVENLTVVTQVSAGIGKETSSETLESTRDLRLSAEEKEASSLRKTDKSSQLIPIPQAEELDASSSYKSDKSELMAPIPEDTSEAISTFEVGSSTDKDGSPTMEIGIDKLKRVTNTVPALVAQAEVTLNKETSATDNLIVVTQVTTGIDEGTANETHQSGGDLQLPFKEEETSNSYDIDKSNLAVPIPELEPPEVISTFNTGDMICGESSPAQETSSDDSPELTNDLLVLTNIKPELVQQTEATLDEQMSSTKVLVAETQDSAANEKETVSKIPESIEDLQPSFGENESVCEIDKSNITVPLSKVKEAVAATAFETDAVTDKITIPGIQSENNDLLKMNNAETALVQQNGVTLIEKMLSVEESKVVTQVSTGIGKETSSETLESTKELQLAAKEKENLSQIDKSNITVPFSEFEDLEADQTSEIDAVTDKFITPVFQSENNNLLPMTNTQTALVQQDGATLLQQMSCVEDSIFLPKVSAEIGKETSSDILVSTKDLQLSVDDKEASNLHDSNKSSQMFHIPDAEEEVSLSSQEIEKFELMSLIPEDTASEAVSTFDIRAEPNQEASPAMETGNNDLVGVTNTVSALVTQEEVTLNDQISATDDSIVVTQVAGGIEEENSSEKPQSMGNLQLSFEEKEASNSYDDKSNLKVSITEVEQTEAVSAFDRGAITHEESSPVIETRNDDSLVLTDNLLAQQAEPIQHEQMSTIEESMVETCEATRTKKGTVRETAKSTRDIKLSVDQEESLHEIDKSNISVPISKIEASEAAPAFERITVTDNIIIPVGESENNNLIEMGNTKTALVHQDQATISEEMSSLEESMVVTQVPARIGKETSSETFESTNDLQLSVEEKEASSFHESDKSSQTFGTSEAEEENSLSSQETEKSELLASIPEDTTSKAVSADDIGVETYQGNSPAMETGDNKLMGVINTVPVEVAQAEITLHEQTSSKDVSIIGAQATGINEETAIGSLQSMQKLELSFDEEANPKSFDINKSNLVVPITEVEETEVVSAFDMVAMTHEDSSPLIESRNDDSLRFTNDLLVPTSPEPALVRKSQPIQHEQMSSIEQLVVETHDATENNKETVSEIPESTGELKLSSEQEESLCKIGESNISAPIPKVDALEAAPAFEMTAMAEDIISPFGESENDDLLEMSNPENTLVHQDSATLLDKISCVEDKVVVTNDSAGIGKDTSSKTPDSTRDLQISFEEKEASIFCESNKSSQMVQIPEVEEEDTLNSHETDKSELVVRIPEDTTLQSVPSIDVAAEADQDESPSMDTENNNLERVINTEPALNAQTETTTLNEQTSSIDDTVHATQVATGIEEETVTETPQLMGNMQPLFAEKELSHSYDNEKSNAAVPILEVEAAEAVSAIEMYAMTHEKSSIIEIKKDDTQELTGDVLVLTNTQPALIQQAEAAPHEQIPSIEELVVETNDATGTEKENMRETPGSARDLQPPFKQEESLCESQMVQIPEVEEEDTLNSHETDKSELVVRIPEDTTLQSVPSIDVATEADQDESPSMDTENNNLERVINTEPALNAQTETTTLNEQTSSIDDTVHATQVAAGIEEETVTETPQLMGNIQPLFAEKELSHSYDNEKSNAAVPILEVEAAEAVSAIEMYAMAREKSSIVEIKKDDTQELTGDVLVLTNTQPALIQQAEAAPHEQIPSIEELVVETNDATGTEKETMRETPGSARDLQPQFKQEESLCESQMVQIPEVEEEDTLNSHETDKSELVVRIPEDTTLQSVPSIDVAAEADQDESPSMDAENNNLERVINTEPALNAQTETTTLNEQTSSIDDTVHATQVAAGIEEETVTETPQLMGNIQPLFAEKELSHSYDNEKSNAAVPILEVEAAEAVSAIEMYAMTHEKSSIIEIKKDDTQELTGDVLVLTNTQPALIQQAEAAPHEQIPSIEELVVETNDATGTEKETMRETPGSARDLQPQFKQEESLCESQMVQIPEVEEEDTLNSHETDKSELVVRIPEDTTLQSVPSIDVAAEAYQDESPSMDAENNNLERVINTEPALNAQTETTTLNEQTSSIDDTVHATQVAAGIEEETVTETPQLMGNIQPLFAEKELSHSYDNEKSNAAVPILEVEAAEAVSAIEMYAMTNEKSSIIEIKKDDTQELTGDVLVLTNTQPALIQQAEAAPHEQIPSIEELVVETNDATGTEKETMRETPGSARDLQPPFKQEESLCASQMIQIPEVEEEDTLNSHETDKSELVVRIPEDTTLQSVPSIDVAAEAVQDESPSMDTENNNLERVINTEPALNAQTETTTLNEQTSSIDDTVHATQVAAGIEEETVTETPQLMGNIQPLFAEKELSHSYDNKKSNAAVPILEVEAAEAVSAIEMYAMAREKSSTIEIKKDDTQELTGDVLVLTNTQPALIQQAEAAPHEQIPSIEELVVETNDATGTEKETMRETPGSARDLQPPFKQEESLCEIDKSYITVPNPEVEALEAASAFEMISGTEKNSIPVEESENNELLEMTNTKIAPVHQDKATLLDQISCAEGSMVVTSVPAGTEKDTSSEIPETTEDLQLSDEEKEASSLYESDKSSQIVQIPEVEENDTILGAVSTNNIAAETDQDDSLAIEHENNKLVGVINTVPILVAQTETAINEKTPSTDDSMVVTQVATGIEEEIVHEPLPSMENLQLSFEEGETSHSYDIGKSNLEVPTLDLEATEAVSAFDTGSITHEKGSPVIEIKNDGALELTDDLLVLTNTETGLIQQAESTPDERMPFIEESLVETHNATGTAKETVREIPGSTKDLQFSFEREESLCEIERSNTTAPPPEVDVSEAAPALEMIAVTGNITIPDGELKNNDLIKISNPETTLVHQDMATRSEQISCVQDSIVVTDISAEIGKDTSSKSTASTRDLQLSVEKKEAASSLNESDKLGQMVQIPETDKSKLIVWIPEDTTLGVMSTIDIAAGSDQNDSPVMENDKDILVGMINTVPASVTKTEATLNEKTSSIDDSVTKTRVAAEIEEETARETQSMGNVQHSVEDEKTSHSYDIGKSNLEVPIPEIEATEAVSAFDIVAMTHEECSPLIKIINDNTLELNDDLLVLTNTEQALVQHTEDTHEQMPTIEVSLVETNDATGTEKETVSETPGSTRDLQLPFKQEERLPEIDESNITVPIPEVEALEPAKTFEMISTNKTNIHVGESENNHLLGKSNPKTALLEKISCVEDSTVVTHVSAGIRKNISSETPYSTRDLDLSVEEKGISSLHESDKSSQTVHIPEDTRIEAESTFAMSSEANQNSSPDMGTENNKSVEVTKAVPALVAQADGNLNEQISSINNSIVVTRVASQIEEGTASEILQSMEDLQLLFEKKEASSSYGIDKSNLAVLIPEAVSAFDTDAKTQKERSSVKETTNNDPLELIDDYLVMTNIEPTLVQQTEATVHKQMSPIEESIFETRDAAETEKETVTVNPESTGDLELSFEQEEGICEIDKSIAVSRAETEPSETDPFEMVAVSDKINIPTIESKNNDLLETTSMKTTLAQQDGATQFKQTSCVEDLMVATYISAEIGKGSSNEIPESTRYLHFPVDEEEKSSLHESDRSSQMVPIKEVKEEDATSSSKLIVPIPEDTKLAAVSNFEIGAEADEDSSQDRDSSPAMETQNNKLVVTNTVPALVAQATLNEQTSDLDDSIVVTKVASGIEEETARETPQSMGDLHLPFEENEASNSCNTDKSNLLVLIPEAEATGVSSFDTDAKTRMESSPVIETRNDDPLELISDYLVLNKTEPALVQWAEATLREQMSYIEEPVVETHIAVATEKKSVTKNPESTGNLQPSLRQEEVRCEIDKSNSVGSIPEVAPSEATPFEMVKVTEKIIAPVIESKNNDLSEMTNTEAGLVQQDEATLSEQMSCIEDSMVVTYITAEIGKETSSEIAESTRDIQIAIKDIEAPSFHESGESSLQAQIPDVEEEDTSSSHEIDKSELMVEFQKNTSEAVSTFNIGGGADPGSSPAMETENKKSAGITSTLPALVAQAEITLNEQLSSIDDSAVVAHVATEIENEIASETPQSMGDFKLSFEEKEASTSYDIDKSDLPVSIPEVEATEAFSAFNTGATSYQKSSPVIKTRNDDPLELTGDLQVVTNTEPALAQNVEATLHEQTSSIEKPVVESHIAAATEKETVTENPVSTRDLHLSLDKEERFCEVDKSNITVPAPEFEASEAAPFEIISVTDKIIIPVIESKNNDLLDMNNTKTALVQQDGATLFEQNSCVDSMVVKYISAEIDKETSNEIPESTKDSEASSLHESGKSSLQVQIPDVEENDALSSHETDKFKSMVLIPEDVGADQNSSPAMETENNKLEGVTNTVPSLVTQAEIALNEQTSSVNESIVVAQVASAIEEETATETPQSMGDIELSFKEEEATEAVSAFNTVLMSHVKSSPVIEPRNEDSVGLPNDLLVLTNTKPALVQKAEAILHEQMLSIEDSVVDKHTTAATEKETENETPESSTEDLQLSVKDVLCEIDKSNVKVAVPEVEATEAAPEFNVLAVPEINIIPVTELENNDIPRMTNTETAPVQLDGASLLEQMSHAEDPMVVTHVSAGIWKETSIQTLESAQDLQLSFKEKEVPDLHESDRSMSSGSNSRNI